MGMLCLRRRFRHANGRGQDSRGRSLFFEPLEERVLLDINQAFLVPLDPVEPFGSQVFAKSQAGTIDTTGQTNTYTVRLDAGQVVTAVVHPVDASLQAGLEVRASDATVLASTVASSAGAAAILQTAPIVSADVYQIVVTGVAGSGAFTVGLNLNATVEEEGILSGSVNDSRTNAQAIDGSSVAVANGCDRLAVVGQSDNGDDFYSFHFNAGQTATLAVAASGAETVHLELQDGAGNLLARGVSGALNATETISDFRALADGTYYARISATAAQPYGLLVTRGADFESEPNYTLAMADDMSTTLTLLGSFRGNGVPAISSETEPNGDIAHANDLSGTFAATSFNTFVASVQGVVSPAGDHDYYKIHASPGDQLTLDETAGISGSPVGDSYELLYNNAGQLLVYNDDYDDLYSHLVYTFGGTGSAYSGDYYVVAAGYSSSTGSYTFTASLLTTNPIGMNDNHDYHAFNAAADDVLTITTTTPGDGLGEPVNDLDPLLELYDPAGNLVAANNNGAPDGRNSLINYTVPSDAAGTYAVRIAPVTGMGDYTLQVSGASGSTARDLTVAAGSIADGVVLAAFPATIRLSFAQPLLLSTLDLGDVTVNGSPATGVTLIDASTVEFDIAGLNAGDGSYVVRLAAASVNDLRGNGNVAYDVGFRLDTTGPVVISSSIGEGDLASSGDLVYTATFSEDLGTTGLGAEDVMLVDSISGTVVPVDSFAYSAADRQVTVDFRSLVDSSYTLTLRSGIDAFRDPVDNSLNGSPSFPLPSGQGNPAADDFVVHFVTDTAAAVYPAPLDGELPLGSLIFDPTVTSAFHVASDTDTYTIAVDAGQKITVILTPVDASVRARLALVGPGGATLGSADAATPGEAVVLQTLPASDAGAYRIDAASLAGTGRYHVQVVLNAAVETESRVPGASDDTRAAAQNLDASSVALQATASRLAVLGTIHMPSNVASGKTVRVVAGTCNGAPVATLTDGSFRPRGTYSTNGTIWWSSGTDPTLEVDLGAPYVLSGAKLQADGNDVYALSYLDSTDGQWKPLWEVPDYSTRTSGLVTRPDYGYTDTQEWNTFTPVTTSRVRVMAVSSVDTVYAISEMQLLGIPASGMLGGSVPELGDDYYSFTLGAGQSSVLALTAAATNDTLHLELQDASGNVLARGASGAANVTASISGFVSASGGTYYAHVSGTSWAQYNLVVTRGADFNREPNEDAATAQNLDRSHQVLGALGRCNGGSSGGAIRVAVLNAGDADQVVDQLNDSTAFHFQATSVVGNDIDTVAELSVYDVVVIGDSSSRSAMTQISPALRSWVEAGGGVVATGWTIYAAGNYNGTPLADINAIVPVDTSGSYQSYSSPALHFLDTSHPVTRGLSDFSIDTYAEYSSGGADAGATVLATINGQADVVVGTPGLGRGVYLGPTYMDSGSDLDSGSADQLFEQAVTWAGAADRSDHYTFQAAQGDSLTLTTTTPGGGDGEPVNTLDPIVDLYAPDGSLVATDDNGDADGRNVQLSYTVPVGGGGTYRAVVRPVTDTSGDYTLRIQGATASLAPFAVVTSTPTANANLKQTPTTYQISFAEPVLATSVDAGDLLINGTAATDVVQTAPNTLSFTIASAISGDGTYIATIGAGALTSLSGQASVAFSASFTLDTVPPHVVSSSIAGGGVVPAGALTYHATFSEPMASGLLGIEDVTLRDTYTAATYTPASLSYDAGTNSVTVSYASLPEGTYELRLLSGTDAFCDLATNPLDGSGAGSGGDYVVTFGIDAASTPYPTPLAAVEPRGSLVYDPQVIGLFNTVGDTDSYTLSVDAGQKITVILTPVDTSVQARLALVGPGGATLGSADAATPGEAVVLQTLPASDAGAYRIDAASLAGIGRCHVQVVLNAAVETEGRVPGASDDTRAAAQNLDASSVALQATASRLAVLGAIHQIPSNVASGKTVRVVAGMCNGAPVATLTDGSFRPRGTYSTDGTIWWWSGNEPTLEVDLGALCVLSGAKLQADGNDVYALSYLDSTDGQWKPLWEVPDYSTRMSGLVTRPDYGYTDTQEWNTFTPVTTSRVRVTAVSSVDTVYAISEMQLLGVPVAELGDDYYSFTLGAGQSSALALTAAATNDTLHLELQDASGNVLARGAGGAANVTASISGFVSASGGTYYARVSGGSGAPYSLVVTRGADFNREPNEDAATVQNLDLSHQVLGALGRYTGGSSGNTIRVAVLNTGYAGQVVGQLNDSTTFHFQATNVVANDIDTVAELSVYDVVVIGDQASRSAMTQISPALRSWVEAGGGVVATGWTIYAAGNYNGTPLADINAIVPVDTSGSYQFYSSPSLHFLDTSHPITRGLSDFSLSTYAEYSSGGADAGATVLATINGQADVVAGTPGFGRGVYLGPTYMNSGSGLNYGSADQLFEQAVAWAGAADRSDHYTFQAAQGDSLTLTTTTPGGGDGEPLNTLDPIVDLYAPDGSLVATDDNGAADGRNVQLSYTVPVGGGGTYRAVVRPATDTSGDYTLRIQGATASSEPFAVATSTPADGALLAVYPTTYSIHLSQPVLLGSVDASDLTIDGVAAGGVTIVDPQTLQFDVASISHGDAVYIVSMDAGSLTSLSGMPLEAFTASFDSDSTSPRVATSSVAEGDVVPVGALVYRVGFSEQLATDQLGPEDVVLQETVSGASVVPDAFAYDPGTSVLTLTYDNLPEGDYTLRLLASATGFRDRRGNLLDGSPSFPLPSGDGTPGDDFVVHFGVDCVGNQAIPAPVNAAPPSGSLIYRQLTTGVLDHVGDADSLVIDLAAGQTATVVVAPQAPGIQAKVELFAPDGTSLGSAEAAAAGRKVWLQTLPVSVEGTYRVEVTAIAGVGGFQAGLVLNAAVETESLGAAANDDYLSAQDIDASFLPVAGGATRGAIVATSDDQQYSASQQQNNNIWSPNVFTFAFPVEVVPSDGGTLTITAKADCVYSYKYLTLDAEGRFTRTLFGGAGTTGLSAVIDISAVDLAALAADGTITITVTPSPYVYSMSGTFIKVDLNYAVPGTCDYFSFHLDQGQSATVAVEGTGAPQLELRDGTNAIVTRGVPDSGVDRQSIDDFVAPTSGVYYARVTGGGQYSLVVTRNAYFGNVGSIVYSTDFESGAGPEWSTRITDNSVPGTFTRFLGRFSNQYAVLTLPTVPGWHYVMNFDLDVIDSWDGSNTNGGPDYLNVTVDGQQVFHETFSNFDQNAQTYPYSPDAGRAYYGWGGWPDSIYRRVAASFTATGTTSQIEFADGGLEGLDNESWGIDNVTVRTDSNIGRMGVVLAGYEGRSQEYVLAVQAGDSLDIRTLTPFHGDSQPQNAFHPTLSLFNALGYLVAVDESGAPDGYNARIRYTAASGSEGIYVVRVTGTGQGPYVLQADGATGSVSTAPAAVAVVPAVGAQLRDPPQAIDILMSEMIRLDSIAPDDLTIDGGATVTGAQLLDGRRIRFSINVPNVGATYHYAMLAGAVTDLQGGTSVPFEGSFTLDKIGPHVAAQVPTLQASAPFTELGIVFDEDVDPAGFTTADVTRFIGPGGVNLTSQVTSVTGSGRNYVIHFNAQNARGTYTLGVGPDITDVVGNAMTAAYTATVDLQSPDLTVPAVSVTPSAAAYFGDTVTIGWTLRNIGSDPASEHWSDRIYLSRDATLSADDIQLATVDAGSVAPLAPQSDCTRNATVMLPLNATVADGWYYVLVQTDALGQQPEANEGNNVGVSDTLNLTIPMLPDLVVSRIESPVEALSGQAVQYSWTLTNQSTVDVTGSWNDYVYLSADDVAGSDLFVGSFPITATIPAGQSITRAQTYDVPGTLQGNHWFIVTTDAEHQIYEHSHENNNTSVAGHPMAIRLSPFPNLQVQDITLPTTAWSSQQTEIHWTVKNAGTGPTSAAYWYDSVWLSQDPQLDTAVDTYLGAAANPSYLNPGDSYANDLTATMPQGIQGTYYIIVQTDAWNYVLEYDPDGVNERDNVLVSDSFQVQLTPPPDLRVTAVNAPTDVFSNDRRTVSWEVGNLGPGTTLQSAWRDDVYLSSDTMIGGGDFYLGSAYHYGILAPEAGYSAQLDVTIPASIDGDYYFIVRTDAVNQVFEHAWEGNNDGYPKTTLGDPRPTHVHLVAPDLAVQSLDAPASATASHGLTVSYRVGNEGVLVTPASAWTDTYYLSSDATLNTSADMVLGSQTHYGVLEPGESYDRSVTWTLPNGTSGTYYLFVVADSGQAGFEPDRTNNVRRSGPIAIASNPADLFILHGSATAPGNAAAGSTILVSWKESNQGRGDTAVDNWVYKVFASPDAIRSSDDLLLASIAHQGILGSGESYQANNQLVSIPINLNGPYWLYIRTDADNHVYEGGGALENNNDSDLLPVNVTQRLADLQVTSIVMPDNVTAGQTVSIQWSVQNAGAGRTNASGWRDGIYLSNDQTITTGDSLLKAVNWNSALDAAGSYTASTTVVIPADLAAGTYYAGLYADIDNSVYEGAGENNNGRVATNADGGSIHVTPNPVTVDLRVVSVDAPAGAVTGQAFPVTWTVQNDRDAATANWYDALYLSRDQFFDRASDTYLGYVDHGGGLATGESYTVTQSFNIPRGMAGSFYVFVVTDRGGWIGESDEQNNVGYDGASMQVSLAPPCDLVVGTITIPANGVPGQDATIGYTVINQGNAAALGGWSDAIYLSQDDQWDIGDSLFGRVYHQGDVPSVASDPANRYSETLTAALPGVVPGDYHVIVRSDIRNSIEEVSDSNNLSASLDSFNVDANLLLDATGTLPASGSQSGTLSQGQAVYYRMELPAGETIRLAYDGADSAYSELYVRRGAMPTRGQFDWAAALPFVSDQGIVLPADQAGTYYVMAYATWSPGALPYTLTATTIPFELRSAAPTTAGNVGLVTLKILGAKFNQNTLFELVDGDGNYLSSTTVYLKDSATAFVTFDLRQTPAGTYGVRATDASGAEPIESLLSDALTVTDGSGASILANVDAMNTLRPGRGYAFNVIFVNDGDVDSLAPLLVIKNNTHVPIGFSGDAMTTGMLQVLGSPQEGPLDRLRPGDPNTVSILLQTGTSAQGVNLQVTPYTEQDQYAITDSEWADLAASLRPASIPDSTWQIFWRNNQPRIGTTWGDYVKFLNRIQTMLSQAGHPTRDVRQLFEQLLTVSPEFRASVRLSGRVLDASTGEPIANLQVAACRQVNGIQVLGGIGTTDTDGNYTIEYLLPGDYQLALTDYDLDMNRDGCADTDPVTFVLGESDDLAGMVLYAVRPAVKSEYTSDTNPVMAVDAAGVRNILWTRGDRVWHSYFNGTNWVDAVPISQAAGSNLCLEAGGAILSGSSTCLLAAWEQGTDNQTEVYFAVARVRTGGGYQWSDPLRLTNDSVQDSMPQISVMDDGKVLVTYTKQDTSIQDDTDIYYSVVDPNLGLLLWSIPASQFAGVEGEVGALGSSRYRAGFIYSWGPFDFLGASARAKIDFSGDISADSNSCTAKLGGSGRLSSEFRLPGLGRVVFEGTAIGSAGWQANRKTCQWDPTGARVDGTIRVGFDWKDGLFTALNVVAPPAAGALRTVQSFLGGFGLKLENGITVGGQFDFSNIQWARQVPFPAWVWPSSVDKVDLTVRAGPYVKLTQQGVRNCDVKLTGTIDAVFGLYPSLAWKRLGYTIILSARLSWFHISGQWSGNLFGGGSVAAMDTTSDGLTITYDPAGALGTNSVYGTNSLLSDVSGDIYQDGAPILTRSPDGHTFALWAHDSDPYTSSVGSQLVTAEFDGTSWSTTVPIPGTLGLDTSVGAAVDGNGNRLAVWSMADSSLVNSNSTFDELQTVRDSADLYYTVYADGTWTAPAKLVQTAGPDQDIRLCTAANGDVVLAWTYRDANDQNHLMSSRWNGSTWDVSVEVIVGDVSEPTLAESAGSPIVFWTQSLSTDSATKQTSLFYSSFVGNAWSAPTLFNPTLPVSVTDVGSNAQVSEGVGELLLPPVPEDCCKPCKKWTDTTVGTDQGCGATVQIDQEHCKRVTTYKPCVPPPRDPNDIVGPAGAGAEHWLTAGRTLAYTIDCENASDAQAAAHKVTVTQTLDADLNPNTFRLGDFGFSGQVYKDFQGKAFGSTRIDRTADLGVLVDVTAVIDVARGVATWTFTAIDPATGDECDDPAKGLLPPNDSAGAGEAFVTYTVQTRSTIQTGDRVDAVARIVFDTEEPIDTPPIFNTFDIGAPASAVLGLPTTTARPDFLVTWAGSDDQAGSGVDLFTVYVSIDGNPAAVWLSDTPLTEAPYAGEAGHTYAFYTVVADRAGNRETAPATPDARIAVGSANPHVIRVDIPSHHVGGTPDVVNVVFSDPMDLQPKIADGTIVNSISLADANGVQFALTPGQFSYDDATNTLSITLADGMPEGHYDLRLDGATLLDLNGSAMLGGIGGCVPAFDAAQTLQSGGADLVVDAYSVPAVCDWNSDSLPDLIVGEKTSDGLSGKVRVYLNAGTANAPVYGSYFYAQSNGSDLSVPASGCLGAFPRIFDWDGDGKKDLLVGQANGHIALFANTHTDADPQFGLPAYLQVGEPGAKSDINVSARATLEVVDWNNDGRYDLVVGALDGKVRVFLNQATTGPADFRGQLVVQDGSNDLVVPSGRASVSVADLNGDGRKDLLAGNTDGQLLFYANVGTDAVPAFNGYQLLSADGAAIRLTGTPRSRECVVDYNGDGILDVLVGAADGLVRLYAGQSSVNGGTPGSSQGGPGTLYVYTFALDVVGPRVTIAAPSVPATAGGPISFSVTYTDANFGASTLEFADITLNTTGTATGTVNVSGTGLTWSVTISNITGDGTLGISVDAGTASDLAGNLASAAGPSATFIVDNVRPTAELANPNPSGVIALGAINARGYLEIAFADVGSGVDLATIIDGQPELVLEGAAASGVVLAPDPQQVGGAFRYQFTGGFGTGSVSVEFLAGSVADQAGNTLAAMTRSFTVQAVWLADDGEASFRTQGTWSVHAGQGFEGDYCDNTKGKGTDTASWSFAVPPGRYRIAITWPGGVSDAATKAPFSVYNGTKLLATVTVNQRLLPADFSDQGVAWRWLEVNRGASYLISSGTLTVKLTDKANGLVLADAVRIERLRDIQLLDGKTTLSDGGTLNFGTTWLGTPVLKKITVKNVGLSPLTLVALDSHALPAGFELVANLGTTTLAKGQSTTFTVRMMAAAGGSYQGAISIASNDPNGAFGLMLSGEASAVRVLDDGDAGFKTVGPWKVHSGAGFENDYRDNAAGRGKESASWTFTVPKGQYRVAVTWQAGVAGAASNAPFYVYDGTKLLGTVTINQRSAPDGFLDQGVYWTWLSLPGTTGLFSIKGTRLVVKLSDKADGTVLADAVRIERVEASMPRNVGPAVPQLDLLMAALASLRPKTDDSWVDATQQKDRQAVDAIFASLIEDE